MVVCLNQTFPSTCSIGFLNDSTALMTFPSAIQYSIPEPAVNCKTNQSTTSRDSGLQMVSDHSRDLLGQWCFNRGRPFVCRSKNSLVEAYCSLCSRVTSS